MQTQNRKNIRLKHWDYASNACYHVTICAHDRRCIFGRIVRDDNSIEQPVKAELTSIGESIVEAIRHASESEGRVVIENYVVMPNHVHLLVHLDGSISLASFVRFFKSHVTRNVRKSGNSATLWQKGYYEHVIRNDEEFFRVWEYIDNNPYEWENDTYYE